MREVDTNLALGVGRGFSTTICPRIVVLRNDSPDTKLSGYPQAQTPDYGARTEVGELIGVVAYALMRAVVAVYKGGVGVPGLRGLVGQFLRVGVEGADSALDFCVYGCLDGGEGGEEGGGALADVLDAGGRSC